MRRIAIGALVLALSLSVAGPHRAAAQEGKPGGTLRVATIGEPPGLDTMLPYGILAQHIGKHVYENLFTFDANWRPVPMLAEGYTTSADGKVYTIRLRRGVRFHDGSTFDAADVVASLQRWVQLESTAKSLLAPNLESITAVDPQTVEVKLKAPSSVLIYMLAADAAPMYPSELVQKFGSQPLKEYVGTGPYRFVEWLPDRHIELARFDGYAARSEPASGFAGKRVAYHDTIRFIPVPDVSVRVAGVQSGQYDVALDINPDMYQTLKDDQRVRSLLIRPFGWPFFAMNKAQGLFADVRLRRAFLAALDMDQLMAAGFGDKALYAVNGSIYPKEITDWYTTAGTEPYNQKAPARAKRLLEEAGYAGKPVRIVTSRQYDFLYKISLVAAQQARAAGFNVDLQVVEWATLVERRQKPDQYEIFVTFNSMSPAPPLYQLWLFEFWPGWWKNEEKDRLLARFGAATDHASRAEIWRNIQALIWSEVPIVKVGDFFGYALASPKLEGVQEIYTMPFWNTWTR
ncbi:MAG TPA: ABC transporter substrate-binding protein [Thermodesulfobacteriota bacterium]